MSDNKPEAFHFALRFEEIKLLRRIDDGTASIADFNNFRALIETMEIMAEHQKNVWEVEDAKIPESDF